MKKLLGLIALSIILSLLNQGYCQPNHNAFEGSIVFIADEEIILQNSWICLKISKETGVISSLIYWSSERPIELLTDRAFIIVRDKKRNVEYKQYEGTLDKFSIIEYPPDSVKAIFDIDFIPLPEESYSIQITYTLYKQALRWDAVFQTTFGADCEANIDFSIPVIANMDYAFWTKDGAPFKLPITRTVRYRKLYDVWTVIPTIILFNDTSDVGLSFVSPFELRKPKLEWEMKDSSFIIANRYLRLSINHPCSAGVYIVPHEADWRPGLAWIYDKYPSYFNPVSESVLKGEGWFRIVDERTGPVEFDYLRQYGVKWVEFYAHNPFFGVYAPPDKDSWIIIDETNDAMSYNAWATDSAFASFRHTDYDSNQVKIDSLRNHNIQTYIYFSSFESWIQYADRFFPGEYARDANLDPLPAWRQCYLMNPDPDGRWGKHILSQVTALLDSYPNVNGIFYDRDDYCDYAYNYDDGVTMIDSMPAYMLGFAQEKINYHILKAVHEHNSGTTKKGVWTNCPTSVEVCKGMDGIMSEALYQAPFLQYLGINRPLILLPYDKTAQQAEEKLKTALWTGHFPSVTELPEGRPESKLMDYRYKPLFSIYKGKKWVLYPKALQLPEGIKGNIFKTPIPTEVAVPDTDYLVAMIDPERYSSKIYPEPETTHDIFRYDRWAKVRAPDIDEIKYCYILSGDYKGINQDSIYRNPAQAGIEINIPAHRVSSLIQLSKKPRYEITRTSSPVLTRGEHEKFEIKVHNISSLGGMHYDILLVTPFGQDSFRFSLYPESSRIVGLDFVIPDTWHLGEDTMKVIERVRNDTTVFTTWIVDFLQFEIPETLLFIHHLEGEIIPMTLVNNTSETLIVTVSGRFVEGRGRIGFPFEPSQGFIFYPKEAKELNAFIVSYNKVGKVGFLAKTADRYIEAFRRIERTMDTLNALFYDNFSLGNMRKWNETLGTWYVTHGVAQGSGPMHLALKYYDVNEPVQWTDYEFQVNTKLDSSANPLVDWIKSFIYFRVQNESTYYRFGIAQGFKAISLFKRVNWNWSLLANCDFNVKKGVWYNLRVEVICDSIKGFLDGNQIISVRDSIEPFLSGGIGIGVTEDEYVNYYDDVVVRKIPIGPDR